VTVNGQATCAADQAHQSCCDQKWRAKSRMGVIGARTPAVKTGTCACRMITFSLRHANEGAHHPAQVSASRAVTLDLRPKVRKRIDDASKSPLYPRFGLE